MKYMDSRELTLRGIILGALITVVFTAANVYLGLKIGLTFGSSIPATIISMAVLRLMGGGTMLENNMVQTQASAAGSLSCIFAALPGLIMVGYWHEFPYFVSLLLTLGGGMTGVIFTIPLRRALVRNSDLPYPEGTACAEILRASSPEGDAESLRSLTKGTAVSAVVAFATSGLRILSDGVSAATSWGASAFRLDISFSLALLGTGYLVGIAGGIAMLLGVFLAWGIMIPVLGHLNPVADPLAATTALWLHKVRFMGAGAIAVAAIWTLLALSGPVAQGLKEALSAKHRASQDETDLDLAPRTLIGLSIILALILSGLFTHFLWPVMPHGASMTTLVILGIVACFGLGFLVASACGYMAGIIGSSSSPISGVGIIAIIAISVALWGLESGGILSPEQRPMVIAFGLFVLSAITASAAVSNDNLQDLKTGQLVGAAPWKQEVALLIGCAVGAIVIPWVLQTLYQAYGFVGAMPREGMDPTRALAAPQPALMAAIAKGILTHDLDWLMLEIGAAIGIVLVVADMLLKRRNLSLPPLAVGMGIYLPADVSVTIAIGAGLGWLLRRFPKDQGTMIASGFIVGESLVGVAVAAIVGATGSTETLSLHLPAMLRSGLGWVVFLGVMFWFGRRISRQST
ncbi:OPT family oligopeptide transporter [Gluconobacter japonicus]|uniref:Oligopeptide transporter, OPT family protein n=1 Tax=Gluconobacter japonicus TaxID=376620 RepID=A0ABQ5WGU4_GLUJA|nr:oligopeptide transporter, OPT family [Gluconobacter japonicus]KXV24211.1 peptide transporter [Gluconobacter japonicus]GBR21416.1 oligopeptide transporter membrane spanning protein [Gluconobacter japonicus NBRC 3271]GLQ59390.1 oligopeptide transporter, OPT family protein [Gluconobacter japonicus]